jgi:hypothetical protein
MNKKTDVMHFTNEKEEKHDPYSILLRQTHQILSIPKDNHYDFPRNSENFYYPKFIDNHLVVFYTILF